MLCTSSVDRAASAKPFDASLSKRDTRMKGSLILTPYFKHTYAVCIGCRSCDVCKSLLDESGNLFWRPTPNTYARYIRCPSHGVLKTVLGESANLSWHPIPNTQMLKHQMSIARGLQTQSRRVSQNVTHEWRAFLLTPYSKHTYAVYIRCRSRGACKTL